MIKIINLTPHILNIEDEDGNIIAVPASGQVARLSESREISRYINRIPVYRTVFGKVDGLPEPELNTIYIVSMLVKQQVQYRYDVLYPGEAIRDESGNIIGCRGLSC